MGIIEILLEGREINKDTNCWEWRWGKTTAGYGEIYYEGKTRYVHRVSAIVWLGFDIKSKLLICHLCNNPRCFNPEHLYIGDDKENHEDRAALITHCANGHEFTTRNTYYAMNSKYPKRQCRKCKAIRESERRQRLKVIRAS